MKARFIAKWIPIATLSMVIFYSCKNSESIGSKHYSFDRVVQLTPQAIAINQIINPVNIVKLQDYMIVQGEEGMRNGFFHVYTAGEMKYLYSFGQQGRAETEFLYPTLTQNTPGNRFEVYDPPKGKYYTYTITDTEAIAENIETIKFERGNPFQDIAYLNDSIFIFNILDGKGPRMHSYNRASGQVVDTLRFKSDFKARLGASYNMSLESFKFDLEGNQLIVAFEHIDDINRGYVSDTGVFQFDRLTTNSNDVAPDQDFLNNIYYNTTVRSTPQYIFAQRCGRPLAELQPLHIGRNFRFDVEVFDRNLEPVALLKFGDNNIFRMAIDEKRQTIYTWDIMGGFDSIYLYKYDLP